MRFKGIVKRMRVNIGSKSEHDAVVLVTAQGKQYKLRRLGGNPFHDEELIKLDGMEISGEGELLNTELLLTHWQSKTPE